MANNLFIENYMNRVHYFSSNDLSIGHYLKLVEERINELSQSSMHMELVDIIELWSIRKLFEEGCRLTTWTDVKCQELNAATSSYNTIIAKYLNSLNPSCIKEGYSKLDRVYKQSFWKIVSQFKCFKIILPETLSDIIKENTNDLRAVLSCKQLVDKFKNEIKKVLIESEETAHILLDKYVSRPLGHSGNEIYLPSNLSVADSERIIQIYLASSDPNLNYVRLICQAKNQDGKFVLSAKTRLVAKRLEKRLNMELLDNQQTAMATFGLRIAFINEEKAPLFTSSNENGLLAYTYNINGISKYKDEELLFYCYRNFDWLNEHFMLNLINKHCEVEGLEYLLMDKSSTAYPDYSSFRHKNMIALYQLYGFCQSLNRLDRPLENGLCKFYSETLKNKVGYPSIEIKLPNCNDDWLTKCRMIFPELDNVARQFNTFVEEDEIDPEYLELLKPMKMTDAKSLLVSKYCEANNNSKDIGNILNNLFDSGSLLDYVEPYKNESLGSFVNLMEHKKVNYNNYEEHQKYKIDFLIDLDIVQVEKDGTLVFVNHSIIEVLKHIWEFSACSYWHLDEEGRAAANEMIKKGWLITDDHLLSREERKYFSFYTDNVEFTNGYEYRNRYAHGKTPPPSDVNAHTEAYLVLLRLFTILLLKVYDDLHLAYKLLVKWLPTAPKIK